MEYHVQPRPTWKDKFTQRELKLIRQCQAYAQDDPAGLPGHQLMLIINQLSRTLDTLPLQEVSPDIPELLQDFFEEKWRQGKLSDLWSEEDERALLQLLSPYLQE